MSVTTLTTDNGDCMGTAGAAVYILGGSRWFCGGGSNARVTTGAEHVVMTRSTGAPSFYKAGTVEATDAGVVGAKPEALPVGVGVYKTSSGVSGNATTLGGYSIGVGLTAADVTAYRNAMNAFNTAMGRAAV